MIPPKPLSREKVIAWMKSAKVDTEGMPDRLYLYSKGRNILVDLFLIAETCGEFDEVVPDPTFDEVMAERTEVEGLK
jgi:hypothetical protein